MTRVSNDERVKLAKVARLDPEQVAGIRAQLCAPCARIFEVVTTRDGRDQEPLGLCSACAGIVVTALFGEGGAQ